MSNLNDAQLKVADYLKNYHAIVQAYMNEHITAGHAMTGKNMFAALKSQLPSKMTEAVFGSALSASVRAGYITGFEGRKRIGYIVAGDKPKFPPIVRKSNASAKENNESDDNSVDAEDDDDDDNDVTDRFVVQVTSKMRIVANKRCFILQNTDGETWSNTGYYSNFSEVVTSAARKLVGKSLRSAKIKHDLVELKDLMNSIEKNLIADIRATHENVPEKAYNI